MKKSENAAVSTLAITIPWKQGIRIKILVVNCSDCQLNFHSCY